MLLGERENLSASNIGRGRAESSNAEDPNEDLFCQQIVSAG
jgi:hypothetical protein